MTAQTFVFLKEMLQMMELGNTTTILILQYWRQAKHVHQKSAVGIQQVQKKQAVQIIATTLTHIKVILGQYAPILQQEVYALLMEEQ